MSLTDSQIRELCAKMSIPLAENGILFKNEFEDYKLEANKSYFVNLEDEYDEKGHLNSGSHWTCFQVRKYPNGKVNAMYFDPFGVGPPQEVKDVVKRDFKVGLPYNTKDIQSMMANACGWYCCAYLHFINVFPHRSGDLYQDTENFLDFFDDLNKSVDFNKNEFILKQFFQSRDPALRKEIDIIAPTEHITDDRNGGIDAFDNDAGGIRLAVETKVINKKN
jgi:hypothetical protein